MIYIIDTDARELVSNYPENLLSEAIPYLYGLIVRGNGPSPLIKFLEKPQNKQWFINLLDLLGSQHRDLCRKIDPRMADKIDRLEPTGDYILDPTDLPVVPAYKGPYIPIDPISEYKLLMLLERPEALWKVRPPWWYLRDVSFRYGVLYPGVTEMEASDRLAEGKKIFCVSPKSMQVGQGVYTAVTINWTTTSEYNIIPYRGVVITDSFFADDIQKALQYATAFVKSLVRSQEGFGYLAPLDVPYVDINNLTYDHINADGPLYAKEKKVIAEDYYHRWVSPTMSLEAFVDIFNYDDDDIEEEEE